MIKPVGDHIKVKMMTVGEVHEHPEILSEMDKHIPLPIGKVVAVGNGTAISTQKYSIGDMVMCTPNGNYIVREGDVSYMLVNQHRVVAKRERKGWVAQNFFVKTRPVERKGAHVFDINGHHDLKRAGRILSVGDMAQERLHIERHGIAYYADSGLIRANDFSTGETVDYILAYSINSIIYEGKRRARVEPTQ